MPSSGWHRWPLWMLRRSRRFSWESSMFCRNGSAARPGTLETRLLDDLVRTLERALGADGYAALVTWPGDGARLKSTSQCRGLSMGGRAKGGAEVSYVAYRTSSIMQCGGPLNGKPDSIVAFHLTVDCAFVSRLAEPPEPSALPFLSVPLTSRL